MGRGRAYLFLAAVLAAVGGMFIFLITTPTSGQMSEARQLDLLENAEAYYRDPERDNATSIALYEHVLDTVDLHPAIEREIMFNMACMLLFQIPAGQDEVRDVPRALEWFKAIVDKYPSGTRETVQSWGYIAQCYEQLGAPEKAAEAYLMVRRAVRAWPEDQRQGSNEVLAVWNWIALGGLVNRAACGGLDQIPYLRQLAAYHPDDEELARVVEALIPAMQEAHDVVADLREASGEKAQQELAALFWSFPAPDVTQSPRTKEPVEALWPVMVTGEIKRALEEMEPGGSLELLMAARLSES